MIAIALAAEPEMLIADEPTTALDVTIQAQILDLLKSLQQRLGMAIMLITHDLAVVAQMAHRVALMYAGQIVEVADAADFFRQPAAPVCHQAVRCAARGRQARPAARGHPRHRPAADARLPLLSLRRSMRGGGPSIARRMCQRLLVGTCDGERDAIASDHR